MPKIKIINSLSEIPSTPEWTKASKFKCEGRIVDENGKSSCVSEGRSYKIISKRERSLSDGEKFVKRFLGSIAVISSLGLALMFKSIYRLFNGKISIRYATLHVPKPLNLVKPSLPINISSYEDLKKEIEKKEATLFLTDESGKHSEKLLAPSGTIINS